jgi:hypothetical protein
MSTHRNFSKHLSLGGGITMATAPASIEIDELKTKEPLWGVKSRVSWGALMAGTVVAVVTYSLLSLLGTAVAMNMSDSATVQQLGTFAGIWAYVTLILAMLCGGWISSLYTVGEFRYEAVLYGVIVWGVTSLVLIPLSTLGIGASVGMVLASHGITKLSYETEPFIVAAQDQLTHGARRGEQVAADLTRELSGNAKEYTSSDKSSPDKSSPDKSSPDKSSSDKSSSDKSSPDKSSSDQSSSDNQSSSKSNSEGRDTSSSDSTASTRTSSSSDDSQSDASQDNSKQGHTISEEARSKLKAGAWYAFGGTLLSMLAAVFGASLGPTFVVTHHKVRLQRTPATTIPRV